MKEIIESGILEEYVLGTLPEKEAQEIARLCARHPELAAEVEAIEKALMKAFSVPVPTDWKKDTLSAVKETPIVPLHDGSTSDPKIIPIGNGQKGNGRSRTWFWAAASFAGLFVLSAAANFILLNRNQNLSQELTDVKVQLSNETDENKVFAASLKQTRESYHLLFHRDFRRIDMEGTPAFADNHSVLFWNPNTGDVIWDGSSLPALSEDEQYQLWAIVDGKPQNEGMMNSLEPAKMLNAQSAQAFAVTIEPNGGSEEPTMEKMVVFAAVKPVTG